jgi:hypothetical protein
MSTDDKILPAGQLQDYLNLCPLCSVLHISIYGINGEIRILRRLQIITIYLGSVHNSCLSPPLCSPLCSHGPLSGRTSSCLVISQYVAGPLPLWRAAALCVSGRCRSWWPGHWTMTTFTRVIAVPRMHTRCVFHV